MIGITNKEEAIMVKNLKKVEQANVYPIIWLKIKKGYEVTVTGANNGITGG